MDGSCSLHGGELKYIKHLVPETESMSLPGRLGRRWEGNIRIDLR